MMKRTLYLLIAILCIVSCNKDDTEGIYYVRYSTYTSADNLSINGSSVDSPYIYQFGPVNSGYTCMLNVAISSQNSGHSFTAKIEISTDRKHYKTVCEESQTVKGYAGRIKTAHATLSYIIP